MTLIEMGKALLRDYLKSLRTVLGFLIVIVLSVCALYLVINQHLFTISFTNVGFAIFLAFGNVCFSWARTYTDAKDSRFVKDINENGKVSIFCAVTFLMSSFFTFLLTPVNLDSTEAMEVISFVQNAFRYVRWVAIVIVVFTAFFVIWDTYRTFFNLLRSWASEDATPRTPKKSGLE